METTIESSAFPDLTPQDVPLSVPLIRAWMFASRLGLKALRLLLKRSSDIERARLHAIRRTKRRRKLSAQRNEERRRRSPVVWPSKPTTEQVLHRRVLRHHDYASDPASAKAEALAQIARAEGISVRVLRRIANELAHQQLQELLGRGYLTLPRLGRLRIQQSGKTRKSVNVRGRVGAGGIRGVVNIPAHARLSFRASSTLVKALRSLPESLPPNDCEQRLLVFGPKAGPLSCQVTDREAAAG
jgi:hypothetical protein